MSVERWSDYDWLQFKMIKLYNEFLQGLFHIITRCLLTFRRCVTTTWTWTRRRTCRIIIYHLNIFIRICDGCFTLYSVTFDVHELRKMFIRLFWQDEVIRIAFALYLQCIKKLVKLILLCGEYPLSLTLCISMGYCRIPKAWIYLKSDKLMRPRASKVMKLRYCTRNTLNVLSHKTQNSWKDHWLKDGSELLQILTYLIPSLRKIT